MPRTDLTWDSMEMRAELIRRLQAKEITADEFAAAQKNIRGRRRGSRPKGVCARVLAELAAAKEQAKS